VPYQGDLAARYLRDHAAVGDVLATNSHCTPEYGAKACDARNFWLAAYAERRVLLEGWAYTPTANEANSSRQAIYGPYWDEHLRAVNDAAFRTPTRAELELLRDRYGVRWLVFDINVSRPSPELKRLIPKRFSAGAIEVYELILLLADEPVRAAPGTVPAPAAGGHPPG